MSFDCILYKMGPHNPLGVRWGFSRGGVWEGAGSPRAGFDPYTLTSETTPMPLPTFQCPADLVHCKAMLPPSYTREGHDNLSPDSALPLDTKVWFRQGQDPDRVQMCLG